MPETKTPVTTYRVDIECEECGCGNLEETGKVDYSNSTTRWQHKCSECGCLANLAGQYPFLVYEDTVKTEKPVAEAEKKPDASGGYQPKQSGKGNPPKTR